MAPDRAAREEEGMMRALLFALALSSAGLAHADRRLDDAADARPTDAESVKQKIRTMRAYALTEALALDEMTASRLFPALASWDDAVDKIVSVRVETTRKLRKAASDAE